VAFIVLLLTISWRRWGNPLSDPGLDLTTAAGWLDGRLPYRDIRYFYGPLGIAPLTAAFAVFGRSLTTAWLVGFAQTALISWLWWRLSLRWLSRSLSLAGLAVVLAIGFSGTLFNYQLPHTAAATAGLICFLWLLLAFSRDQLGWAGLALGAAALTRPEALGFAVAATGGWWLGTVRVTGWVAGTKRLLWLVPTALLVVVPVYGYFAAQAGFHRLFLEEIWPVDFIRVSGNTFIKGWAPYSLTSVVMLVLRGAAVILPTLALLGAPERWRQARSTGEGSSRRWLTTLGDCWFTIRPLLIVVVGLAVVVVACRGLGIFPGSARLFTSDATRLLLPMTALPALSFLALGIGVRNWWKKLGPPLGGSWPVDAALLAGAAAGCLRVYNLFSTDNYATYYAPPAVLVALILLSRAADRRRFARGMATAIVWLAALALVAHASIGNYADDTYTVHSRAGSYRTTAAAGPNIQRVVDLLQANSKPGDRLLEVVQEPGFDFLTKLHPALFNATFLPGTLANADQDHAAAKALVADPPRYVVVGSRNFAAWGFKGNGIDFNTQLMNAIRRHYRVVATFGDVGHPPPSPQPAQAFTVYELSHVHPV
jgi:hypothetical protein